MNATAARMDISISNPSTVMAGFMPATHDLDATWMFMSGRDKPGPDESWESRP